MIFLFNYFKLAIWSSIYFYKPNDLVLKIIHKNIDDCGCIAVKFVQWILPKIEVMYDIDKKTKENQWFYDFEEFYDLPLYLFWNSQVMQIIYFYIF